MGFLQVLATAHGLWSVSRERARGIESSGGIHCSRGLKIARRDVASAYSSVFRSIRIRQGLRSAGECLGILRLDPCDFGVCQLREFILAAAL